MANGEYARRELLPGVSVLTGFAEECCIWLVEGRDRAAIIDTGMGKGDLRAAVDRAAPGKELLIFNTHCHFDHSAGNFQFPAVYMHPACAPDQDETEAMPLFREAKAADPLARETRRLPLKEGDCFDLGGVTLEVYETPGHTPGCVSLLDRAHRLLFAGDLIVSSAHNVWMLASLPWVKFSTVSMECYLRSLQKVEALEDAFDGVCGGHDPEILGKEYLTELIRLAASVVEGTAQPEDYAIPTRPGEEPFVCRRVVSGRLPAAILYQDEIILDRK